MKARILTNLLILALVLGASAFPALADPLVPTSSWTDDFNDAPLDTRWSWINEDPLHWSLTARPGFMHIIAQPGWSNFLVQDAPADDYIMETRVLFEPGQNIQRAGLILIQDGDNSLWLMRGYCDFGPPACPGNAIYFDHIEDGGAPGSNFAMSTASTDEAYMRIVRQGRAYAGYYSEDGDQWTLVGTHLAKAGFAPVGIGIFVNYSPLGAGEIPADFDYFRLRTLTKRVMLPLIVR
jgi:hypothetical protein